MTLYTQRIEDFDPKLKDATQEERAPFIQNYSRHREGKNAAFKDCADNLKSNEKRPRSKFFKNYKRKILVLDEAWRCMSTLHIPDNGRWCRDPNNAVDSKITPDSQPESKA
jgi:hypothetical protein